MSGEHYMAFVQNVWYPVAWADELGPTTLLARTIAGTPIVMFRTEQGGTAALLDRCPHRFAPLSRGRKQADGIACGYHGLAFNAAGACIHNPHGPIVRALVVNAYPCVERHEAIWAWPGDPGRADPALIPDLSFIDRSPASAKSHGYLPTAADYRLGIDNIMDLSHVDYLHPTTLGGGALTGAKATLTQDPASIKISWLANSCAAPPAFATHLADPAGPADVWTIVTWYAPGVMVLEAGAVSAGRPHSEGVNSFSLHVMTPETLHTTHYFYGNTRTFLLDDAVFNKELAGFLFAIFNGDDKPMLEAQQSRIGERDFWDLKPALLSIDSGAVAVRRRLEQMIAKELVDAQARHPAEEMTPC
jgi:phenylpropionate dioxygenase-like ring-hydroxylating dioxygenase large terminal subunit